MEKHSPIANSGKNRVVGQFSRSLRAKLIVLMLSIALIPLTVMGIISYYNAKNALEAEATDKLVAVRDIKAGQIEDYFKGISGQVRILSEDRMTAQAMHEFKQGFFGLSEALALDQATKQTNLTTLRGYYQNEYLARLNPNLETPATVDTYWPANENTQLAQFLYTAANPKPTGQKDELNDAGDGSPYSRAHESYHPLFRDYLDEFGYYDIFLVEPDTGYIVYTVFKEMDYGTSLLTGPYKDTKFAAAFRAAKEATDPNFVYVGDYELYHPSYNAPAAFIASPIFDEGEKIGVLLFQVPIHKIDTIMQAQAGLGETGETILVSSDDFLLRSNSRFSEEPTLFERKVDTEATRASAAGETGVKTIIDYRGEATIIAHTPLQIAGLNWSLNAKQDQAEAFAVVYDLRNLSLGLIVAAAIVVVVIALFVSASITKPISAMATAARKLAVGNIDQTIEVNSQDEIGTMAMAFTEMLAYFKEMSGVADQLAEGDLTAVIKPRSDEDALGRAFQRMIANLRHLVGQVIDNAGSINSASGQLASVADQAGQATNQIAGTIQQVAQGVQQQTESVTQTAASMEQVSRVIDGVTKGAQEQASAINESSKAIEQLVEAVSSIATGAAEQGQAVDKAKAAGEALDSALTQIAQLTQQVSQMIQGNLETAQSGQKTAQQTVGSMDKLGVTTEQLAQQVRELGKRSGQIGAIIEVIDGIAAQTNLLALNAAIEAARAGEHGKGFAVVADEVRQLAERSSKATNEIREMIEAVQAGAEQTAEVMKQAGDEVRTGVGMTREAGAAFEAIAGGTAESAQQIEDTLAALSVIQSAAEQLHRSIAAVQEVAERNRSLTSNMKSSSESVKSSIEQVSAVVEENAASTEEMAASAEEVQREVESIASVSEQNSASVQEVSAATEEMTAQVEEVTASAQTLSQMAEMLQALVAQFKLDQAGVDTRQTPPPPPAPQALPVGVKSTRQVELAVEGNGRH